MDTDNITHEQETDMPADLTEKRKTTVQTSKYATF